MLTLRNRLVLVNLLVFLITLIVLTGVITNQILGHLYEQLDRELAQVAGHALGHVALIDGRPRLMPDPDQGEDTFGPDSFVRLLDTQGAILAGQGDYAGVDVARRNLPVAEQGVAFNQRGPDGAPLRVFTQPIYAAAGQFQDGGSRIVLGYVQAAARPEEILEITEQIRRSLLIGIPLALLIAGLAGLYASRRALQSLTLMTQSAAAISADSVVEQRLPVPRAKDEVQALAQSFNATLERLAAAFIRQRRFTADASHELRTPVTAILGQAELALSRPRSPQAYQESLRRIQDEAERMQRLIGRLLALARAESGRQILDFEPTDVAILVRTLTETLAPQLEDQDVELRVAAPPAAVITTDADSLTQIVLNLLENAIAYTRQGQVEVAVKQTAEALTIQISDTGPGIPPDILPLIFEPFYRADPSRRQERGHVGLGLALSYELTHLLGGTIEAANRPQGGAVFTFTLPGRSK
ncbi:MAG: HAMP domain-containing histidine kinase [Caldilineaceae bacterium]|nr:HAMP domain-containing histidine kinase [Caldilineaceae bacterium]